MLTERTKESAQLPEDFKTGYINKITLTPEGNVLKNYNSDVSTVFVSPRERYERELAALRVFGGKIAPQIISYDSGALEIVMTKLEGANLKYVLENGVTEVQKNEAYQSLGAMLRVIHDEPLDYFYSPISYAKILEDKAMVDIDIFERSELPDFVGFSIGKTKDILVTSVFPALEQIAAERENLSYTHGDFWTNNAIGKITNGHLQAVGIIDWEFFQKGFPEEDLSQVFMWEFAKAPFSREQFELTYGKIPDRRIPPFVTLKLIDYMEGASIAEWQKENGDAEGFLTKHLNLLNNLLNCF